jgi:hypothetical protein
LWREEAAYGAQPAALIVELYEKLAESEGSPDESE